MLLKEVRSAGLIVAYVGLFFSLLMLIPWITSVLTGWEGGNSFLWSGLMAAIFCILVVVACFGDQPKITPRFGILVVNMLWFLLPILCAIPLATSSANLSFVDSLFEATSGLTTTGSTIMTDILSFDRPILLWRALMQWVGGLGILSLGLILLPFLRIGGMQLFKMESSDRSDKPLPRLVEISRSIIIIYVILSLASVVAYLFVGLTPFDALTHGMTTVATGGFSEIPTAEAKLLFTDGLKTEAEIQSALNALDELLKQISEQQSVLAAAQQNINVNFGGVLNSTSNTDLEAVGVSNSLLAEVESAGFVAALMTEIRAQIQSLINVQVTAVTNITQNEVQCLLS